VGQIWQQRPQKRPPAPHLISQSRVSGLLVLSPLAHLSLLFHLSLSLSLSRSSTTTLLAPCRSFVLFSSSPCWLPASSHRRPMTTPCVARDLHCLASANAGALLEWQDALRLGVSEQSPCALGAAADDIYSAARTATRTRCACPKLTMPALCSLPRAVPCQLAPGTGRVRQVRSDALLRLRSHADTTAITAGSMRRAASSTFSSRPSRTRVCQRVSAAAPHCTCRQMPYLSRRSDTLASNIGAVHGKATVRGTQTPVAAVRTVLMLAAAVQQRRHGQALRPLGRKGARRRAARR
jgi:hypothetical protein